MKSAGTENIIPEEAPFTAEVDVVLDDTAPAHQPAEQAEAEDGRKLGALDGKAEDQRGVADAYRDKNADAPSHDQGGPGELG